eukprot:gnl/Chilomastix_caulleri/6283.p4 GENE.gnl/Chilomastix_caulleri/6283~~gnl/Chilomastix_caulleri/6283.p4  ORF type:complete len:51 (-),score=2.46 gnl/Chilomastix_caulleri/6283:84-236(-)
MAQLGHVAATIYFSGNIFGVIVIISIMISIIPLSIGMNLGNKNIRPFPLN